MKKKRPILITTDDRSHTLFVPSLEEQYHSRYGAIAESRHIFIANGYKQTDKDPLYIFEMGFGTGLNVLLTWLASRSDHRTVYYSSIEHYPLNREIYARLNYPELLNIDPEDFTKLHQLPWNREVQVNGKFYLHKIHSDFLQYSFSGFFDLVYFDAFGPDKQPEMWDENILKKVYAALNPGGIFVTYSAKGSLRRSLEKTGYRIERLPGPPGKREMIRAIKPFLTDRQY